MRLRVRGEELGLIAIGQVRGVLTGEAPTDELLVEEGAAGDPDGRLRLWLTPGAWWLMVAAGKMVVVPKPYPEEFRRDVVAVARRSETPLAQVTKDFGISENSIMNWMKKAAIENGAKPGVTAAESTDVRRRLAATMVYGPP
nr:hypothetical protein [Rathayibacter iranicus]